MDIDCYPAIPAYPSLSKSLEQWERSQSFTWWDWIGAYCWRKINRGMGEFCKKVAERDFVKRRLTVRLLPFFRFKTFIAYWNSGQVDDKDMTSPIPWMITTWLRLPKFKTVPKDFGMHIQTHHATWLFTTRRDTHIVYETRPSFCVNNIRKSIPFCSHIRPLFALSPLLHYIFCHLMHTLACLHSAITNTNIPLVHVYIRRKGTWQPEIQLNLTVKYWVFNFKEDQHL